MANSPNGLVDSRDKLRVCGAELLFPYCRDSIQDHTWLQIVEALGGKLLCQAGSRSRPSVLEKSTISHHNLFILDELPRLTRARGQVLTHRQACSNPKSMVFIALACSPKPAILAPHNH